MRRYTVGGVGNLADSVEHAVARGLAHGTIVLVACSGGADSVALAASAVRVGVRCAIGHVDHGLRAGSTVEAYGVRDLARHLGVEFYLKKIDKLNTRGPGLEAAARSARYEALAELGQAAGATVVATAHTRRDQAETLLLRLFRGAGPGALAGVRRRRVLAPGIELVRPLLDVSRAATEACFRANSLGWVDDPHHSGDAHPPRGRVAVPAPGRFLGARGGPEGGAIGGGGGGVDVSKAPFPWTRGGRLPGDRFRPAAGRTKKVADLWIDAGIPREQRARLALLADAHGRIFWVEGLRPGPACGSGGISFRLRPEMKPSDGPLPSKRRHESCSATMDPRPDQEPR